MSLKRKLLGVAVAVFLAAPAMADETGSGDAGEPPLVISYHTIMCDRPPCLPMRNASRPPDFKGKFTLRRSVFMCRTHPCGRPPYGAYHVSGEGWSRRAKKVVLHGERRKHNLPYYYMHRIADGEITGTLEIEGDCWFDEKSGRVEILARRIVPQEWEADVIDK